MNKTIKELINNKQNNYIIKLLKIASDKIILPLRGNLKKDQINTKSRIDDFVTQADKMVEEFLSFELKKVLSDSVVIGEEECSENPNLLKSLSKECLIWTCDPIDGTYNYINMSPNFCTMVALCFKENPIACWLYFPTSGVAIISSISNGLYIIKDENIMEIKKKYSNFSHVNITGSINLDSFFHNLYIKPFLSNFKHASAVRCAGFEAIALSCGITNFIFHKKLTPWDHSPLCVLAKSTKNIVGLTPNCDEFKINSKGKLLVADSKKNWDYLLNQLK